MLDNAPLDDEPETDDERRAVALARADRARGIEPVPLDEVLREFNPRRAGSSSGRESSQRTRSSYRSAVKPK